MFSDYQSITSASRKMALDKLKRRLDSELSELEILENQVCGYIDHLRDETSAKIKLAPKDSLDYRFIHFNDGLVYKEMEKRGVVLKRIPGTDIIEAKYNDQLEYLINGISHRMPFLYHHLMQNKFELKQFLEYHGFPVAQGAIFNWKEEEEALAYAQNHLNYPVVVKPTNKSGGRSVFCPLSNEEELRRAFHQIASVTVASTIMVEKFYGQADDYRFFVVGGKVCSIARRTPAKVVGDGFSTVSALVEKENDRRMNPRNSCLCRIKLDDAEAFRCLQSQGMTPSSIPQKGQPVYCRFTANVSLGGECETVTDAVHPSYSKIAEDIFALFPNLPYMAVDLLIADHLLPAVNDSYVVCECSCTMLGLSLHTHPSKGRGDAIITPIIDQIFPMK